MNSSALCTPTATWSGSTHDRSSVPNSSLRSSVNGAASIGSQRFDFQRYVVQLICGAVDRVHCTGDLRLLWCSRSTSGWLHRDLMIGPFSIISPQLLWNSRNALSSLCAPVRLPLASALTQVATECEFCWHWNVLRIWITSLPCPRTGGVSAGFCL